MPGHRQTDGRAWQVGRDSCDCYSMSCTKALDINAASNGGEGERGTAKSCCCTRGCKSSWCCNRKVGDDEQSASDATADRQGGWPGQQRPFANVHGGCSFRHCNNPSRIGVDPKQDRMALCPWVSAGSISWYECIDSFECYQTITTLTCRHTIIEG